MQATPENLQQLSTLLTQSLSPAPETRHAAEKSLTSSETQEGFLLLVLTLVRDANVSMDIRQAAGVYFKNVVRKRWAEETEITQFDRTTIKSVVVPIMVALSTPNASRLQSQIGEAVAEIAEFDFPERWPTLMKDLRESLSPTDFTINNGVLTTAHSICKRWRSMFRSDGLFTTIKFVLDEFMQPYSQLFGRVDEILSNYPSTPLPANVTILQVAQTLHLLIELYYDLNSQDFPEYFEDNNAAYMGDVAGVESGNANAYGLIGKYLRWSVPELMGEEDDDVPGPIQNIWASICEIAELYALKYTENFPQLGLFVKGVWEMLIAIGMGTRDDHLVSSALGFLSAVVRMGSQRQLFEAQATLEAFCEKIVLPNMTIRSHEEEMFEDDPLEFIRQDLDVTTEHDTRRSAATEFTRALMQQFDQQITAIIGGHIERYLQAYNANPGAEWKAKDTAIYLLTSIASRGSTQAQGVTSVNSLVDVVQFFSENVFSDLKAESAAVHPILQVDAIKYLYTFRNQLTKEQLLQVLPELVKHLRSDNYVVYSYAAITIERILFVKQNNQMLFNQADVRPFAEDILMACFGQIQKGATPEKIAENDYLMKCVMRVIITARQTLTPGYQAILQRLVAIIGETSKNPSNPKFNQYNFESISALIRYICGGSPAAVEHFESNLFPPIQYMLTADVAEFIPYAFQICSQLLELHPTNGLPPAYENLLQPLLHSALWESRGNVPALVRLWKALLIRGAPIIVERGHIQGLLGIFQRLVSLKSTDVYALDLLEVIFEAVPIATMSTFAKTVFMLILNRLQTGKTPAFRYAFSIFFLSLCAYPSVGPVFVAEQLQAIQPGLMAQILETVVLPETRKTAAKDRKVVAVGLTRLLTDGDVLLQASNKTAWPMVMEAVLDLFFLNKELQKEEVPEVDQYDPEESGFQASFSKLGASEPVARDPLAAIGDPKLYLSEALAATSRRMPGQLAGMMAPLPQEPLNQLVAFMGTNNHQIG